MSNRDHTISTSGSALTLPLRGLVAGRGGSRSALPRSRPNGTADNPLAAQPLLFVINAWGAEEASNLALEVRRPAAPIFAGSLPPRLWAQFKDGALMQAFSAKGRFTKLLRAMPVHVVMFNAALLGAAIDGLEHEAGE